MDQETNNQVNEVVYKSKYILRIFCGDWWITGNHVIINDSYFEYRKRNWHLISVDAVQFHWQYVESIIVDKHIFGATIKISAGEYVHVVEGISKKTADEIRKLAQKYISMNTRRGTTEALASALNNAAKGNSVLSIADEIVKLKKLYEDGVITIEEFEIAKKKILS